jgi:hypothetical protein
MKAVGISGFMLIADILAICATWSMESCNIFLMLVIPIGGMFFTALIIAWFNAMRPGLGFLGSAFVIIVVGVLAFFGFFYGANYLLVQKPAEIQKQELNKKQLLLDLKKPGHKHSTKKKSKI